MLSFIGVHEFFRVDRSRLGDRFAKFELIYFALIHAHWVFEALLRGV